MAPRSSHNKHSDGNSRHGNELGGHRSGSTPRNRHNSYEGSGTDRSNVPGPNSNSEGTRDTSSESRRRDHSQEATDSQDHGNTERDEPGDPGNRKRQLNRAVNEYLGSSKKFKSDSPRTSAVYKLHNRSRGILRYLGPFIHMRSTFIEGSRLASAAGTSPEASSRCPDNGRATLDAYQKTLGFVPGLKEQTEWARINDPSGIEKLAAFLDQAAIRGRSDDCASLRSDAVGYIRPIEGIPELDRHAKKDGRGFFHHATARLLCPRHLQDSFDEDRESFCRDVQNGRRIITHNDLPSLLYPEDDYNPDAIDEKLLQSPFLLSCYRRLFTGPRTAMKEGKGRTPGKKCIADIYGVTEVTPVSIAYVAVLSRFALSSRVSWAVEDGTFNASIFFENIMDLFNDEDWAKETLAWWTSWVFGDGPTQDNRPRQDDQSTVAILTVQRAARKRAAALESQVAAQESEPAAQEDEPEVQESEPVGEESESGGGESELADEENPSGEGV